LLSAPLSAAAAENFAARLAAIWDRLTDRGLRPLTRRAVARAELPEARDRDIAAGGELASGTGERLDIDRRRQCVDIETENRAAQETPVEPEGFERTELRGDLLVYV